MQRMGHCDVFVPTFARIINSINDTIAIIVNICMTEILVTNTFMP